MSEQPVHAPCPFCGSGDQLAIRGWPTGHNYPEPVGHRAPIPPPPPAPPIVLFRGYGCLACGGEIGFEHATRSIRCQRCRRIHHLTLAPGMDRQPEDAARIDAALGEPIEQLFDEMMRKHVEKLFDAIDHPAIDPINPEP